MGVPKLFCQSCTMPIDNLSDRGTEKDGSKSSAYCKYCYQQGNFTDPHMSMEKMEAIVKTQMGNLHLPASIIQRSVDMLPHLRRWQKEKVS
ncbi:MAG TPA: zinc ribbon domain-containing protein [Puia sp.]|nr:zinc ribbon domain-containing protein [Puia sp.]